ncbi:MAG: spermidine synthase, partial [Candidatus Paceibacteria bacterium]
GLNPDNVDLHKRDGRMFLKFTDNKYDIIIVDAYSNEMYIPWTLTTREFWNLTKDRLKEGGVVSINVNSASRGSDLLSAIKNTMASVFSEVHIYHTSPDAPNYILVAGEDINLDKLKAQRIDEKLRNKATSLRLQARRVEYKPDEMMLTDDRAPVEFLTDKMFLDYVLENS